ncbi:hypothetical protein O1611_g3496 [Lasiodiplodia mahajangana]|uniref:Uncharacterized protein n=1 Tax=Lasiodiplodia mahajangana TaxID=1108764 RepID=A0ACC2JRQ9_9PEZI|nr:hypothetical protein O1611_g3496 [Lasiodiplodia mahajangana]
MPSTIYPVISSDELSDEATTITTFSNTMSFIRHVMFLVASLPIAFLSKSPVFKAIALLCATTTFYSFPMTPKTAQVICTLSFVLSTTLYYINGGIPKNQEDNEIFVDLAVYVTSRLFSGNAFEPTHALVSFVVPYAVKAALKAYADCTLALVQLGTPPGLLIMLPLPEAPGGTNILSVYYQQATTQSSRIPPTSLLRNTNEPTWSIMAPVSEAQKSRNNLPAWWITHSTALLGYTPFIAFLRGTYYGDGLELFLAVDEILKAIVPVGMRSPNGNYESVRIALAMLCGRGWDSLGALAHYWKSWFSWKGSSSIAMREFLSEVFINTWHIMLCSTYVIDFEDMNEVLVHDDRLGQDQLTAATMSD